MAFTLNVRDVEVEGLPSGRCAARVNGVAWLRSAGCSADGAKAGVAASSAASPLSLVSAASSASMASRDVSPP